MKHGPFTSRTKLARNSRMPRSSWWLAVKTDAELRCRAADTAIMVCPTDGTTALCYDTIYCCPVYCTVKTLLLIFAGTQRGYQGSILYSTLKQQYCLCVMARTTRSSRFTSKAVGFAAPKRRFVVSGGKLENTPYRADAFVICPHQRSTTIY